jgi:hypothetical protein
MVYDIQEIMSERVLDQIQAYTTRYPNTRIQFSTVVDAFEYLDDMSDMSLLNRLLNRMIISPALASAVCSLGVGYEQHVQAIPPDRVPEFNTTLKSVGRIAFKNRDSIDDLRDRVTNVRVGDESIESLVRIASLDPVACAEQNNRFRGYKCDVPKEVGVEQCGLNTNFTCEKGVTTGTTNCDVSARGRCRLSLIGRENKARSEGRKRVGVITNGARTAYLAAQS